MKIARIRIKNIYNLKNVNLDFSHHCALVVGPNGCGKTNIIKCIVKALHRAIGEIERNNVEDLLNYQQPDGENSFITIDFKLSNREISKLLKLRMISIFERTIRLCRSLLPENVRLHVPDQVMTSARETVPLLWENLRSTIENLHQWQRPSEDADVVISYVDAKLHFSEVKTK